MGTCDRDLLDFFLLGVRAVLNFISVGLLVG
jgi:hypothetical protein